MLLLLSPGLSTGPSHRCISLPLSRTFPPPPLQSLRGPCRTAASRSACGRRTPARSSSAREAPEREPMQKDAEGVGPSPRRPAGTRLLRLRVCGGRRVADLDPYNATSPSRTSSGGTSEGSTSPARVLAVGGGRQRVPRDGPHRHFHRSAVVGDDRDYYVYTPPGYDPQRPRGATPSSTCSTASATTPRRGPTLGRTHVILDNLIAARQGQADAGGHAAGLRRARSS